MAQILVIDDEAPMRILLRTALEKAGHEVAEAADGAAGLACLAVRKVDLVITDIVMPHREGLETIMEIRRSHPGLKIIAISGSSGGSSYYLDAAKSFGADGSLAKPLSMRGLLTLVTDLTRAV